MSMENNKLAPPPQISNLNPLPLERVEKLKVFAILSARNDLSKEIFNDQKLSLSLTAAYNGGDAIIGARQGLLNINLKPEDYKIPVMMISIYADKIIQQESKLNIPGTPPEIKIPDGALKLPEKKAKKSTEEITAHILYVFDKVGTDEEKETAKKVIDKFKKCVKKTFKS